MSAPKITLEIIRGKTLNQSYMVSAGKMLYKDITGWPTKAPLRATVTGHGMPDNWAAQILGVLMPPELNMPAMEVCTVVDADTVEFNHRTRLNLPQTPTGSPTLCFPEPYDLTDWNARAQIRNLQGDLVHSFHSDASEQPDSAIEVSIAGSTVTLTMSAEQSAAMPDEACIYDIELLGPSGDVLALTAVSPVRILDEVTA